VIPSCLLVAACALAIALTAGRPVVAVAIRQGPVARITWADTARLQPRLEAGGLASTSFQAYVERTHQENVRRVHEGDLDHLVFFLLQSTGLSPTPPIEPALSAKSLVEGLPPSTREAFLRDGQTSELRLPTPVGTRIAALLRAIDKPASDARLIYFGSLIETTFPVRTARLPGLTREYFRAMRFLYQKEFVAQRAASRATAIADLYRTRGLSTDTAVEAGFVVHLGLGVVKGLQPDRRIRRVLIVGPGMDLAPRTGLRDTPPESYQPWAVVDTLLAMGLSRLDDMEVTAADINPRVVDHLRRSRATPPVLSVTTDITEANGVSFSPEYREYFAQLGQHVSAPTPADRGRQDSSGHLLKTVRVSRSSASLVRAASLDIVTERLTGAPFDLVIATNILPYFDDLQLALATSNIAAMLAPGGFFLHNEPRPTLGELTSLAGLPFEQSRSAVIATVKGAPAPLYDSVFLHVKK
jgi:hypothetical protein